MKKAKYLITGAFGLKSEGTITDTWIVAQDQDSGYALLFHPPIYIDGGGDFVEDECGSFEFAKKEGLYWVSAPECEYINVTETES